MTDMHAPNFLLIIRQAQSVSLCPEGMPALSGSNNNNKPSKQPDLASNFSSSSAAAKTDAAEIVIPQQTMAKEIQQTITDLMDGTSEHLEQDTMEGVDAKDWVSNFSLKKQNTSQLWNNLYNAGT